MKSSVTIEYIQALALARASKAYKNRKWLNVHQEARKISDYITGNFDIQGTAPQGGFWPVLYEGLLRAFDHLKSGKKFQHPALVQLEMSLGEIPKNEHFIAYPSDSWFIKANPKGYTKEEKELFRKYLHKSSFLSEKGLYLYEVTLQTPIPQLYYILNLSEAHALCVKHGYKNGDVLFRCELPVEKSAAQHQLSEERLSFLQVFREEMAILGY